ncbi:protein LYK5-like [Typha angustifolia]|uniref:protein LYK5-like n=1 Tax=Typha angustifolia TaxID=59011 RepID=UPI003C2B9E7F
MLGCQALQKQNLQNSSSFFLSGNYINVPLRCACPTRSQRSNGVNYLVSYLVDSGDTVFRISQMFGVLMQSIHEANELDSSNDIYPFTTLLIPLKNQPKVSQVTSPSQPPPPFPPSSPPPGKSSTHKVVYIVIGVAVAALILIASVVAFAFLRTRKEAATHAIIQASDSKTHGNSGLTSDSLLPGDIAGIGLSVNVYKYEELALATGNFSDEKRIEGSVYHAILNGVPSAVKVINRDVSAEIDILKRINHFNLIRLLGLCFDQGHWYLISEFAERGPLSNWIFHRSGSMVLNWMQRVQIALDVADGLDYLHSYTEPAYVHMDIRSSNILLDESFRAKISNFGHARLAGGKEGEFALTRHIVGMRGYTAPEYLEHGLVSVKLDVYAYGVVLLEIVTGREASAVLVGNGIGFDALNAFVRGEDVKEKLVGFMDPLLEGSYRMDSALMMVRLIERCLNKDAGSRPNMGEVAQTLSKISAVPLSGQNPSES